MDKGAFLKECATALNIISKDELLAVRPERGSAEKTVEAWLEMIPAMMREQLDLVLRQELTFLSNDLISEYFVVKNEHLKDHTHLTLLYSILVYALEWGLYSLASGILFLVDRASYRYGNSAHLMKIVDFLWQVEPGIRAAPQVIVRKGRLMKDSGDLHGAMYILDALVKNEVYKWDYKSHEQFVRVSATCEQIKGQIYHNLGLWKTCMGYLVESANQLMSIKDYKGVSYSHGLITRCLTKLTPDEYLAVKNNYPAFFETDNPCYEGYSLSNRSVELLERLSNIDNLFSAKHKLFGNECLLMYADQQTSAVHNLHQTIMADMKKCLTLHDHVDLLQGVENFYEFIKGLFTISQTLSFSRIPQDRCLSRYLEQLTIELYAHLCSCPDHRKLQHNRHSVRLMNGALAILGLPYLKGTDTVMRMDTPTFVPKPTQEKQHPCKSTRSHPQKYKTFSATREISEDGADPVSSTYPHRGRFGGKLFHAKFTRKFVGLPVNPATFGSVSGASGDGKTGGDDTDGSPGDSPESMAPGLVDISWATVSSSDRDNVKHLPSFRIITDHERQFNEDTPGKLTSSSEAMLSSSEDVLSLEDRKFAGEIGSPLPESIQDVASASRDLTSPQSSGDLTSQQCGPKSTEPEQTAASIGLILSQSRPKSTNPTRDATSSKELTSPMAGQKSTDPTSGESDTSSTVFTSSTTDLYSRGTSEDTTDLYNRETSEDNDCDIAEPLVNLASVEIYNQFTDLQIGESSSSSTSSVDYISHWQLPEVEESGISSSISRAHVLTYNPVNGQWRCNSTMAYIGPELELGEMRGSFRDVFEAKFLHQDEPLGRYVCKRYRRQRNPSHYIQDVICQMVAGYYVTKFNEALASHRTKFSVQFLPVAHLQLLTADGELKDWVNVEPFLHGQFNKLTNNWSYVNQREADTQSKDLATALSHFSYVESRGSLMLVDIQGWLPVNNTGIIYLTDPQFHTSTTIGRFSTCDHKEKGMERFWKHVHHQCNDICHLLHLQRPTAV